MGWPSGGRRSTQVAAGVAPSVTARECVGASQLAPMCIQGAPAAQGQPGSWEVAAGAWSQPQMPFKGRHPGFSQTLALRPCYILVAGALSVLQPTAAAVCASATRGLAWQRRLCLCVSMCGARQGTRFTASAARAVKPAAASVQGRVSMAHGLGGQGVDGQRRMGSGDTRTSISAGNSGVQSTPRDYCVPMQARRLCCSPL